MALALRAIRTTENGSERYHPIDRLADATSAYGKIIALTREVPGTTGARDFTEGDADFSTTEKAYILELIQRPWPVEFGEAYSSLKGKLS